MDSSLNLCYKHVLRKSKSSGSFRTFMISSKNYCHAITFPNCFFFKKKAPTLIIDKAKSRTLIFTSVTLT